jgi:hypothetical protein
MIIGSTQILTGQDFLDNLVPQKELKKDKDLKKARTRLIMDEENSEEEVK